MDAAQNWLVALGNVEVAEGTAKPAKAVVIAGHDGTNVQVPRVFAAPDGQGTVPGLFVNGQTFLYNGSTWDRRRVANKSARSPFTNASSVNIVTPGSGKKINPWRVRVTGVPAGEMVDLKDGATIIKSVKADAQGNALFEWPDGGTAGRSAAINNVYSAAWTTASTGSAYIDYNEE